MSCTNTPNRSKIQAGIFGLWGLAVTLPSVALLAHHLASIPSASVAAQTGSGTWELSHFLGDDCGCSSSIADRLLERGPVAGTKERVRFIGSANVLTQALQQRGFSVECVSAAEAEGRGVLGAPWLLIYEPEGNVAYSGGYAEIRPRAGVPSQDLAILSDLKRHQAVVALPAFGCATSDALRRRLDPLGLKYSSAANAR